MSDVSVVHVVAKTHLDLGFTALASEVEERYLTELFPRALATAAALRERGGPERLVWTTGSWILHRALLDPSRARARTVAEGVERGDLAWHALAVTTHTELMDAALLRSALAISARLDARFGGPFDAGTDGGCGTATTPTVAAKLTDVPGHTRAMVPLLAEAGVTFLHIGVNPAWPVPEVPPVFRWQAPGGQEVVVAYQAGGYGGTVQVPGCDEVLAFLHSGDNLGPPTVDEVLATHRDLSAQHPGATVRASTLSDFARALTRSGAVAALPVVTAEIGDPWLFGAASDPTKLADFRHLLRTRRATGGLEAVDEDLLLVAEHTWGLDQKEALPDTTHWDRAGLAAIRSTSAGRRFECSWAEQRTYLGSAARRLAAETGSPDPSRPTADWVPSASLSASTSPSSVSSSAPSSAPSFSVLDPAGALAPGWRSLSCGEVARVGDWELAVDEADGAVTSLVELSSGRSLADAGHRLGLVRYQSFDAADYERFYAGLTPAPEDQWWARWDNTKPGIEAVAAARSGLWTPSEVSAWHRPGEEVLVRVRFSSQLINELGAPGEVWMRWRSAPDPSGHGVSNRPPKQAAVAAGPGAGGAVVGVGGGGGVGVGGGGGVGIEVELAWSAKAANRLPEAIWWSFNPCVAQPERWVIEKLGQEISPLDVVTHGGRALHSMGDGGLRYQGHDGPLTVRSLDAGLVAPGQPNLLNVNPPLPDMCGGWHLLLADNCWGTNFPMWIEGPAHFRAELSLGVADLAPLS